MSTTIIGRIDEMGNRINDLEKSIGDLMQQVRISNSSYHYYSIFNLHLGYTHIYFLCCVKLASLTSEIFISLFYHNIQTPLLYFDCLHPSFFLSIIILLCTPSSHSLLSLISLLLLLSSLSLSSLLSLLFFHNNHYYHSSNLIINLFLSFSN